MLLPSLWNPLQLNPRLNCVNKDSCCCLTCASLRVCIPPVCWVCSLHDCPMLSRFSCFSFISSLIQRHAVTLIGSSNSHIKYVCALWESGIPFGVNPSLVPCTAWDKLQVSLTKISSSSSGTQVMGRDPMRGRQIIGGVARWFSEYGKNKKKILIFYGNSIVMLICTSGEIVSLE